MPWLDRLARFRSAPPEKPAADPKTDEIIAERLKELGAVDETAAPVLPVLARLAKDKPVAAVEPAAESDTTDATAATVEPAPEPAITDETALAIASAAEWLAKDAPAAAVEPDADPATTAETAARIESAAEWLAEDEQATRVEPDTARPVAEDTAHPPAPDETALATETAAEQPAAAEATISVELEVEPLASEEPVTDPPADTEPAAAIESRAADLDEPEVAAQLPATADLATLPGSAPAPEARPEDGAITTVLFGIDIAEGEDPAHVLDLMSSLEELAAVIFRRGDVTYPAGPAEMLLVCPERTPQEVRDAVARLQRASAPLGTLRAAVFNLDGDPRDSLPELQAALAVCRATGLQLVDKTIFQGG